MQIKTLVGNIGHRGAGVVGLVFVLMTATTGCDVSFNRDAETPERAAQVLNVAVPQDASDISFHTDSSAQGNCTDLSFLLPTNQWQPYVENYFREQLIPSAAEGYSCGDPRPPCNSHPAGKIPEHVKAEDSIRVGNSSQYRALLVISECIPGKTLISWKSDGI